MRNNTRQRYWLLLTALALLLCNPLIQAKADESKIDINITGLLLTDTNCTFDAGDNATVGVDFGNISFSTTSGFALEGEYRKTLNAAMHCTGDLDVYGLMTFVESDFSSVSYDGHQLIPVSLNGTVSNNLGIEILVNGEVKDINAPFAVDMNNLPQLFEAELVQIGKSDSVTSNAALTASVTLVIDFQ